MRSLYFFEGETITVENEIISPNKAVELDASQNISIVNGNKKSRCLILQGKPINERVVQYGPFVMNSRDELVQAFNDFNEGKFGELAD